MMSYLCELHFSRYEIRQADEYTKVEDQSLSKTHSWVQILSTGITILPGRLLCLLFVYFNGSLYKITG